jgi:hypothetical protein
MIGTSGRQKSGDMFGMQRARLITQQKKPARGGLLYRSYG